MIRTYNRIVPIEFATAPNYPTIYTMTFLRERAQRAGPNAVALFGVMEDVRNRCLAETGLTGKIGHD
ncbi:MAG TPA: hypothetical protein PLH11_06825 [Gemmobacter sp.]|nr:hypothetical protein [Gemmobacter sp.]